MGTAGTYAKVTTNPQGQVISGASLADTDIPNLSATKITSGTLAVAQGGTGAATAQPFFVLAGPGVGPTAGAPSFRTLVAADIPSLDASKITSGTLSNSLINWAAAPVTTVAGRTGAVALSNTDISGLGSLATVNAVSGGSGGTITDDSITNADINSSAAIADTKLATIATVGKVANSATTATSAGTANAIVARDASGNFTASTITATLNGNATNVTGTVALANGGTGATTAASARANLGAAASGANTDITSLTNLTSLSTTGNVGVGTVSPNNKLDINVGATAIAQRLIGSGVDSPVIRFENTSAAGGRTYHVGSTATGSGAGNGFAIYDVSGNSSRMLIHANGNVGIGTTTPLGTLHVNGSSLIGSNAANQTNVSLNSGGPSGTRNLSIYYSSGGTNGSITGDYSLIQSGYGGVGYSPIALNPIGGNVGIGTTAPNANLQIGSQSSLLTATPISLSLGGTHSSTAGANPKFLLWDDGTSSYGMGVSSNQMDFMIPSTARYAWHINGVEKMRFDANGNVGISTTSPPSKLAIGTAPIAGSGGGRSWMNFGVIVGDQSDSSYFGLKDEGVNREDTVIAWGDDATDNLRFIFTNHTQSDNEFMRITGAGNVGIGTATPSSTLDVNGNVTASGGVGTVIYSTQPGTRFYGISAANTPYLTGESLTITVPAGAARRYRIVMRQMLYNEITGGARFILNTSNTNSNSGALAVPYQAMIAGAWSTVSTESYVTLAGGSTTTYYVWVVYHVTPSGPAVANESPVNRIYCDLFAVQM